jgi:hypothetical protein
MAIGGHQAEKLNNFPENKIMSSVPAHTTGAAQRRVNG